MIEVRSKLETISKRGVHKEEEEEQKEREELTVAWRKEMLRRMG